MKKLWPVIKNPLLTAGFVLLGLLFYSNFSYMLPFGVASTNNKTLFTAEGTGEVTYVPDTALIYLGVNKTAATQEEAKNEANEVINKITANLKKLGVEEKNIKTTNFSINQDYFDVTTTTEQVSEKMTILPMPPRDQKPNGYTANVNLEVRVKSIDKAEQVIDAATKDGATQVGSYQMVLDETKQKELEDQARLEAVKNAKEKAKELSNAAGIRLGRVVNIQESGSGYPVPMMARTMELKAEDMAAAMPATEINPGENKISVSVVLSFQTY